MINFSSSLFRGKNLPSSVWHSDVLYLPEQLAAAHKAFLVKRAWLADYQPELRGGAGGQAAEDAREHVINRFLNSAVRMQFVCADPDDNQPEVREMVFDQLGDGHIFLLDLAAGNGAGTLAMLSLLCELRLHKVIPKLPVNVTIFGVDFSEDALIYYAEMLDGIRPWLASAGIVLSLTTEVCDLARSGNFSEVLESFFDNAKKHDVRRFLCVISALSGAKKEGVESMHDSLKFAAAQLSHSRRDSSWLWVEPNVRNIGWFTKIADSLRLVLTRVPFKFFRKDSSYVIQAGVPLLTNPRSREFKWYDPHTSAKATSNVVVLAFRNK